MSAYAKSGARQSVGTSEPEAPSRHSVGNAQRGATVAPAADVDPIGDFAALVGAPALGQALGDGGSASAAPGGGAGLPDGGEGGGERLPSALAGRLGVALGADLGHVRIHRGPEADRAAKAAHAQAFTRGSHIYFRAGAYAPGSAAGERLLVHELQHVVQANSGDPATGELSKPSDAAEREAEAVAAAVSQGEQVSDLGPETGPQTPFGGGAVQRKPDSGAPPVTSSNVAAPPALNAQDTANPSTATDGGVPSKDIGTHNALDSGVSAAFSQILGGYLLGADGSTVAADLAVTVPVQPPVSVKFGFGVELAREKKKLRLTIKASLSVGAELKSKAIPFIEAFVRAGIEGSFTANGDTLTECWNRILLLMRQNLETVDGDLAGVVFGDKDASYAKALAGMDDGESAESKAELFLESGLKFDKLNSKDKDELSGKHSTQSITGFAKEGGKVKAKQRATRNEHALAFPVVDGVTGKVLGWEEFDAEGKKTGDGLTLTASKEVSNSDVSLMLSGFSKVLGRTIDLAKNGRAQSGEEAKVAGNIAGMFEPAMTELGQLALEEKTKNKALSKVKDLAVKRSYALEVELKFPVGAKTELSVKVTNKSEITAEIGISGAKIEGGISQGSTILSYSSS